MTRKICVVLQCCIDAVISSASAAEMSCHRVYQSANARKQQVLLYVEAVPHYGRPA